MNFRKSRALCLELLKDGRIASGAENIIIYNKNTYKPDLIINDHSSPILYIKQLSSGFLASCSEDKTVKIFKINENSYHLNQILEHKDCLKKIIELENKQLISCCYKGISVFFNNNNEYKKYYEISTNGSCYSVVQTKYNEICYSESSNNSICFYNLHERKTTNIINNIESAGYWFEKMVMINRNLMLIGGHEIYLVNVNKYSLIKVMDPPDGIVDSICLLNENYFITGGRDTIAQWRIDDEDLIVISKKEKIHSGCILDLLKIRDGRIISSGESDHLIRILS